MSFGRSTDWGAIEAIGIDVIGVAEGEIVEHWGEFDVVGMLQQPGVIYAPR